MIILIRIVNLSVGILLDHILVLFYISYIFFVTPQGELDGLYLLH